MQLAYKYRSGDLSTLARDLAGLAEGKFFAAPRRLLNDPFEGRFTRQQLDAQLAAIRRVVSKLSAQSTPAFDDVLRAVDDLLSFVDKCGVFSLSGTPLHELLWAHYGGSHQGFCIGYDLDKLMDFEPSLHTRLDVQYRDRAPAIQAQALLGERTANAVLQALLGVKSTAWQYEQEVRVVSSQIGPNEHDFRAVKAVIFGLRCPDSTRMKVMETLAGRGVTYQQIESPEGTYSLTTTPVADAFAGAPYYKSNFAPIAEGAILPEYVKPDLQQYASYLHKAAEIVRREPYCLEIQSVDFSPSRSTPGAPVIYVQYLRATNKWVNRYLTLAEVDQQFKSLELDRV